MHRPTTRRTFLHQGLAAVTAAGWSDVAHGQPEALAIIDTHQHLWDLSKFRLPWLERAPKLNRSFVTADYLKAAEELSKQSPPARIVKAVYMEVDVAPEQQQAEADYLVEQCKAGQTPTVAAVISGRPAAEGFARYVTPFKGSRYVKGLRQVLHVPETPPGYCTQPAFVRGVRLLGELGLSFDLCMRAADLPDAAKLIDACPDTRFILDHCGNPDLQAADRSQWQKDVAAVAQKKNVVCKVSGFIATARPDRWAVEDLAPIVNHVLSVFGPDRVMFGGDWPVCTLAASLDQWVAALRAVVRDRKPEDQRKLFHDNAARIYGLG